MIGVGMLNAMHCVICGATDYTLSCGGPTICPKCDCGNFDAATVEMQAKVIHALRQEIESLRAKPQYLANCQLKGACRRECETTGCTNFGKVIVVRRCVEPKQDGIVYPRMGTT